MLFLCRHTFSRIIFKCLVRRLWALYASNKASGNGKLLKQSNTSLVWCTQTSLCKKLQLRRLWQGNISQWWSEGVWRFSIKSRRKGRNSNMKRKSFGVYFWVLSVITYDVVVFWHVQSWWVCQGWNKFVDCLMFYNKNLFQINKKYIMFLGKPVNPFHHHQAMKTF